MEQKHLIFTSKSKLLISILLVLLVSCDFRQKNDSIRITDVVILNQVGGDSLVFFAFDFEYVSTERNPYYNSIEGLNGSVDSLVDIYFLNDKDTIREFNFVEVKNKINFFEDIQLKNLINEMDLNFSNYIYGFNASREEFIHCFNNLGQNFTDCPTSQLWMIPYVISIDSIRKSNETKFIFETSDKRFEIELSEQLLK